MSYVLTQGDICFVVTSPLDGDSDVADHVRRHGDGVRVVAYRVDDAREAHDRAVARGGRSVQEPLRLVDDHGAVRVAAIAAYGDTVHALDRTRQLRRSVPARLRSAARSRSRSARRSG